MDKPKLRPPNCSWVDGHGHRIFGYFIKWEEGKDFAVVRQQGTTYKCRIYKANLTFEVG